LSRLAAGETLLAAVPVLDLAAAQVAAERVRKYAPGVRVYQLLNQLLALGQQLGFARFVR